MFDIIFWTVGFALVAVLAGSLALARADSHREVMSRRDITVDIEGFAAPEYGRDPAHRVTVEPSGNITVECPHAPDDPTRPCAVEDDPEGCSVVTWAELLASDA